MRATCIPSTRPGEGGGPGPGSEELHHLVLRGRLRKLGENDFGRIQRLCQHQDNLLSRATQAPSGKRRNMRRAAERMTVRIQNLINELHHKTARYLVDNFDVILLPAFETSDMVTRGQRQDQLKDSPQPAELRPPPVQELPETQGFRERQDGADRQRGIHLKDSELDRRDKPQAGRKKDSDVLRRTADGPGPQRRTRDIPARFGRYPLPETARLRVRCNKPQCLLAKMYPDGSPDTPENANDSPASGRRGNLSTVAERPPRSQGKSFNFP